MTLFNDSDLISWYAFTEGNGTTLSDYNDSNNGTLTNSPAWEKVKTGQYCLDFDGSNCYVSIPDDSSLSPNKISVCFWIKTTSTTQAIIDKYRTSEWNVHFVDGKIRFEGVTTSTIKFTSTTDTINDGDWHHVVVAFDGSLSTSSERCKIYIDGVSVSVTVNNYGTGDLADSTHTVFFGKMAPDNYYFDGKLANIFIFSRMLLPNEINWLYRKTYIE